MSNFLDFASFKLSKSFGLSEKKATSDPDIKAEKSNNISKITMETIRGTSSVLKLRAISISKIKIKMVKHPHLYLKESRRKVHPNHSFPE